MDRRAGLLRITPFARPPGRRRLGDTGSYAPLPQPSMMAARTPPVRITIRKSVPPRGRSAEVAERTAREIQAALKRPLPIHLTVNDNRRSLVSTGGRCGELRLSVHWSMVPAAQDLVGWLRHRDAQALARLRALHQESCRPETGLRARGRHHDLAALLEAVNRAHFDPPVPARITWARRAARPPQARRRTLQLGSRSGDGTVRIHPVLDAAQVPEWVVCSVIFHELLHAVHPPERLASGRRRVHTAAFREAEEAHPDHARAATWRCQNLQRLLVACTEGWPP